MVQEEGEVREGEARELVTRQPEVGAWWPLLRGQLAMVLEEVGDDHFLGHLSILLEEVGDDHSWFRRKS
jgi:hypothetical protein